MGGEIWETRCFESMNTSLDIKNSVYKAHKLERSDSFKVNIHRDCMCKSVCIRGCKRRHWPTDTYINTHMHICITYSEKFGKRKEERIWSWSILSRSCKRLHRFFSLSEGAIGEKTWKQDTVVRLSQILARFSPCCINKNAQYYNSLHQMRPKELNVYIHNTVHQVL